MVINLDNLDKANIEYTSPDGFMRLEIPQGTSVLDADGKPLRELEVHPVNDEPDDKEGLYVAHSYELLPDGATFDPAARLTLRYDSRSLPYGVQEDSLKIGFFNSSGDTWKPLVSEVDLADNSISAEITHLTRFAVLAEIETDQVTEPTPTPMPYPTPGPTPVEPTPTPVPSPMPTPAPPPVHFSLIVAVDGQGASSPGVGTYSHEKGAVVDLLATPSAGWQFDKWTGQVSDPDSPQTAITMSSDRIVTAHFSRITHELNMGIEGQGQTTPASGAHTYPWGTEVTITASPAEGWEFSKWSGDVADPDSATTSIRVNSDKHITAEFTPVPPRADFRADRTSVEYPETTVQFTDLSTGYVTSWEWDFGDGFTSDERNPSHEYFGDGQYTVKLTVRGPDSSDTRTRTAYITVTGCPT